MIKFVELKGLISIHLSPFSSYIDIKTNTVYTKMDNFPHHKVTKIVSIRFEIISILTAIPFLRYKLKKDKKISKSKKNTTRTKKAIHNIHNVGVTYFSRRLSWGLFQVLHKVSFIFKSNLELTLYNILKLWGRNVLIEASLECKCFYLFDLWFFFYVFHNSCLKLVTGFKTVTVFTANISKCVNQEWFHLIMNMISYYWNVNIKTFWCF